MDWSYFIYFAVVAVLLWGVGAWAAWKDKRTEAYVTTHERREQDGAPTVVGGVEGASGHHCGHSATETDEHGHDAMSSQTEL